MRSRWSGGTQDNDKETRPRPRQLRENRGESIREAGQMVVDEDEEGDANVDAEGNEEGGGHGEEDVVSIDVEMVGDDELSGNHGTYLDLAHA